MESYLQAVEQGHICVQVRLGNFFFHGKGVEQDYGEAVKWYRRAAEQGDMEAQYRLCLCFLAGMGVETDEHEAAEWCARAGEKDTVPGEFRIGGWYFYGCDGGIEQDVCEAAKWYHRAFAKEDSWPIINKLDLCLAIISALLYFLSPIDLIPDSMPLIGYFDDAAVVAACWQLVGSDVGEYERWREKNGKVQPL